MHDSAAAAAKCVDGSGVEASAEGAEGAEVAEGEDGGEVVEDRLEVVEDGEEEGDGDAEEVGEDSMEQQVGGEEGEVTPVEWRVGSRGGSRWRRNGCRFVRLLALRNGSNVFVIFCNVLKKKKIKQDNKNMQVKVGNNEKAVYNCFITTIADK